MSVRSTEGPGAGDDVGALPVDDPPAVEGLSAGRIAGAASLLSIGNVLNRILGLVRTQAVPAYVILHDSTLAEIAQRRPADLDALSAVGGMGAKKLERYGPTLLALLEAAA